MTREGSFYAHGKLLLTGEYLVLDGALALALPTRYGQSLKVDLATNGLLKWQSFDHHGDVWFDFEMPMAEFHYFKPKDALSRRLLQVLRVAKKLNPHFLANSLGYFFQTHLGFPRAWGLGTSSTLLYNMARYAQIDPFTLAFKTFGGSGYDIACAGASSPLTYQLASDVPKVQDVDFKPLFKENLYFVYLNQKQQTSDGIGDYQQAMCQKNTREKQLLVAKITELTQGLLKSKSLGDFEHIIQQHEMVIAHLLNVPTVQSRLFADYWGKIKSLGAWGGDFILATGNRQTPAYFKEKGYATVLSYEQMFG